MKVDRSMKKPAQLLSFAIASLVPLPVFASNPDRLLIFFMFTPASLIIGAVALALLLNPLKPQTCFRTGLVLTGLGILNVLCGWSIWSRERLFEEIRTGVWDNEAITAGTFIVPVLLSAVLLIRNWHGRAA
jgi:hypothetical protein